MADDDESDDALVARAGRGDRSAAAILIARHSTRVHALCRRMLKDRAAADDAMQETFLKLWEHAGKWQKRGLPIDAWLYRVASNACFDRLRRRRRDAPEEAADEIADEAPSAVGRLAADDRARAVRAALDALPERQRIAMTLCHYQEMTNIEAAAAMATTVEAVEGLLSRARKTLRESLGARRQELLEGAE